MIEGGTIEAQALFTELSAGGRAVKTARYPGTLVELEGGGRIGLRLASKSGPPTIDVRIPGVSIREIKFIPGALP
jgi:hypothetical protein